MMIKNIGTINKIILVVWISETKLDDKINDKP